MRFFFDECVSADLAVEIAGELGVRIVNSRDENLSGAKDHEIIPLCVNENLIIVTKNGKDFIRLLSNEGRHPGLIVLPGNEQKIKCRRLIRNAIHWLCSLPEGQMENCVLKVYRNGKWALRQ